MTLTIRPANRDDVAAISRICLLTSDAGASGEHLHEFGELPGLVYAVPYVEFIRENLGFAFVLVNPNDEAVGYVVGTPDTRAFESYTNTHWWPRWVDKYQSAIITKPDDIRYIGILKSSRPAADGDVAFSPAHMHINILEEYQRQGWGRKLIATAIEFLKGLGLECVWLGIDPRNVAARNFYNRIGFREIVGAPDDAHLGLSFEKFS